MHRSIKTLFAFVAFGGFGTATAQFSETEIERTETVFTEEALAKRWRLSTEEWGQYKTLMEGPRGIWSPSLDPITVLGIHAETDAERQRYAELLVMIEFERVEQELLFQRAYDEAAHRLFPTLPRVTLAATEEVPSPLPGIERVAFVGSIDAARCPTCPRELARLMRSQAGGAPALDLFLADAADDEALRTWARTQRVSPDDVRSGRITLNHARGPLAVPATTSPIAPRLMQRLAGQWLPMGTTR
jgi:integrating conjugative element protein (TIGR03759 family)